LDLYDKLAWALTLSKGLPVRDLAGVLNWWGGWHSGSNPSLAQQALHEQALRNGAAKYVVYGHTHYQEVIPLNVCNTSTAASDQVYFNTGTWRKIHEQIKCPSGEAFASYDVMTYLAFFKEDERQGHPYEFWSEILG
jgi:hypothetical protein